MTSYSVVFTSRNQLKSTSKPHLSPHPHSVTALPSPLATVPAMLTSDLLQVEAHLQSRVGVLEREKTELSGRLVRAEASLLQAREQHGEELERAR